MKIVPSFQFSLLCLSVACHSLPAQFVGEVRDEVRRPLPISAKTALSCNLSIFGQVLVGARTSKGGQIQIRNLGGPRLVAVALVLRLHSDKGRYADQIWRGDKYTQGSLNQFILVPTGFEFPAAVSPVSRAEFLLQGAVYDDNSTCGPEVTPTLSRFRRSRDQHELDIEEAIAAHKRLSSADFEKAIRKGLFEAGPYSRETSAAANLIFKSVLLNPSGGLREDYAERLQQMRQSIVASDPSRVSTRAHQKQ